MGSTDTVFRDTCLTSPDSTNLKSAEYYFLIVLLVQNVGKNQKHTSSLKISFAARQDTVN